MLAALEAATVSILIVIIGACKADYWSGGYVWPS